MDMSCRREHPGAYLASARARARDAGDPSVGAPLNFGVEFWSCEECMMSSECDIHKGLCCQFQRRHRQAPRKVCSYFKDPLICIGPVASDQVKELDIEHTAGEKRLTGHASGGPAAFNHIRR